MTREPTNMAMSAEVSWADCLGRDHSFTSQIIRDHYGRMYRPDITVAGIIC